MLIQGSPPIAFDRSVSVSAADCDDVHNDFVTITVGQNNIVPGIDRILSAQDLGHVIEVAISPRLGFGSEPHQQPNGMVVPANSCLIYRIYVHRIRHKASADDNNLPRNNSGSSLHLSAVRNSEAFKKILHKASLDSDAGDGVNSTLCTGSLLFRRRINWGLRFVTVTPKAMRIYKYDDKTGQVIGGRIDREYTFGDDTVVRFVALSC